MIRAQCLVHRGPKVLMVRHHFGQQEWWCLPGGGVEAGETPPEAALRELQEECCVTGKILSEVSSYTDGAGVASVTFLVDIAGQEPHLGRDPEISLHDQIMMDLRWMLLEEIPERDRAYLFAAGLLSVSDFLLEISQWGDEISYPAG
jgi:8-oxo-dGTP diphosphatase